MSSCVDEGEPSIDCTTVALIRVVRKRVEVDAVRHVHDLSPVYTMAYQVVPTPFRQYDNQMRPTVQIPGKLVERMVKRPLAATGSDNTLRPQVPDLQHERDTQPMCNPLSGERRKEM